MELLIFFNDRKSVTKSHKIIIRIHFILKLPVITVFKAVFKNKLCLDKFCIPVLSQLILELFSPQPINLWNFNSVRFRFSYIISNKNTSVIDWW